MRKSSVPPPLVLPTRDAASHKGSFGRVLMIGGARGMAGSIAISSIAALHTGSGLVTAAVPDAILDVVAGFHLAVMTFPVPDEQGRFGLEAWPTIKRLVSTQNAIGCGPGMTTHRGSVAVIHGLLTQSSVPVVFDADAINVIAEQGYFQTTQVRRRPSDAAWVLTPHAGELARLMHVPASIVCDQHEALQGLVDSLGITLVVKGGPTRVFGYGQQPWTNSTGNPGMATAGSGDALTGIITSLLGQGLTGWDAARLGVWLHGYAGDDAANRVSQSGMTAEHLLDSLARVADDVLEETPTSAV